MSIYRDRYVSTPLAIFLPQCPIQKLKRYSLTSVTRAYCALYRKSEYPHRLLLVLFFIKIDYLVRENMPSWIARFLALAAAPCALVLAKPEQIRGVSSPIFHYYLQAYPQDREFFFLLFADTPFSLSHSQGSRFSYFTPTSYILLLFLPFRGTTERIYRVN